MQIKERGDKFQLLRYAGYSKDKKRATVEVAGNISKYAREIPDDLAAKLEPDEIEQLTEFLKKRAEAADHGMVRLRLDQLASYLGEAQSALDLGMEVKDAEAIYKAIKSFQKAMKKAGYSPARGEGKQAPGATGQQSLLAGDPAATA